MKRFYKEVSVADGTILLDGRPVRTPARALLAIASPTLAEAIADEWRAQSETIEPFEMRLTGLANAAIDRVAPDPAPFLAPLAAYAESDLLCYRADAPDDLVAEQSARWDPLIAWAAARYDVRFAMTAGIVHTPQPPATIARLGAALAARDAFRLAPLAPIVTIAGSLVIALALTEGVIAADAAFDTAHLDELWQARHWGEDHWALETREAHRKDFLAAARFLELVG